MYGLTRGTITLIGAAVAGVLLWAAVQVVPDRGFTNPRYWAILGLIAAAGLVMALSQLLGGWTKWGWPRLSATVFLFAFVPVLVAAGWVLLAGQPQSNWFKDHVIDWSEGIGIDDVVRDLLGVIPVLAFAIGLVFGFVFDTTGPRTAPVLEGRRGVAAGAPPVAGGPPGAAPPERRVEEDRVVTTSERRGDVAAPSPEDQTVVRDDRRVEIREGDTPTGRDRDPDERRPAE
ncbi:MAG: hypothetical protein M3M94_02750 [Actinomycetota bacterium]|nr:hypothetical protein [Actinomycetota bacterium]